MIKKKNTKMHRKITQMICLMLAVFLGLLVTAKAESLSVKAEQGKETDFASDYAAIGYDTEDGLASAEINALTQTKDGYIWAGAYSGLYRYDGYKFEQVQLSYEMEAI